MGATVSAVIPCLDLGRHLPDTVASVERQTHRDVEVVLVVDPSTDAGTRQLAESFSGRPRIRLVGAESATPGGVRNAGVHASRGTHVVCLDVGDGLDPRYLEKACARLGADPDVAFVASWVSVVGPRGRGSLRVPPGCDLTALLGRPDAIPPAPIFRRRVWEAVGGFDETLVGLADYEFWLRVLAHGFQGVVLAEPLVDRVVRRESVYRRTIEPNRYLPAMRAVLEKHRAAFESDPATALCERDRLLQELGARYRPLVRRRDDLVAELDTLNREAAELTEVLRREGRELIDWGDLRRTSPVSRDWGYGRGKPIDRYYIEQFLESNARDIRGRVLEVQESDFTVRFGGARVEQSDVVDIDPANRRATIVADLRHAPQIAADAYDCVILTQTLHVIDDMRAVLSEVARILKPGGVLLATLPCASRVCLEYGPAGDFWRVTEAGARRLFGEFFPPDRLETRAHGNVLVNVAFLYGLACHELAADEFATSDPYFPLLVGVRAVKSGTAAVAGEPRLLRAASAGAGRTTRAAILLYHRVAEAASDVHGLCVRPAEFVDHIEHLRRCYRPMALDGLAAAIRDGAVPPGAVALTFDDGYVDNLTTASPILSAYGVPATFFVNTERLDEEREFWWDTLERILVSGEPIPPALELVLDGRPGRMPTATPAERLAAHWALHRAIVGSPLVDRDAIMRRLVDWSGLSLPVRPAHRAMTGAEIRRLAERPGHAIGGHGTHHLALPPQPPEIQHEEVATNKARLERLIGRPVVTFAYPFGAHSDATVDIVRAASFQLAVTCEPEAVAPGMDPLRLPRLEVRGYTGAEFARVLGHHLDGI